MGRAARAVPSRAVPAADPAMKSEAGSQASPSLQRRREWPVALAALGYTLGVIAVIGMREARSCGGVGCPPLEQVTECRPDGIVIVGSRGERLSSPRASRRIHADSIPLNLERALVSVEDKRFEQHSGVDWKAVPKSVWTDITALGFVRGASTIPMQVGWLLKLEGRRRAEKSTWRDKLVEKKREVLLAWHLDKVAGKRLTLACYMELVPLGNHLRGVHEASWALYGRRPENLMVYQAAQIAALPKSPATYDPRVPANTKRALARRNLVLRLMHEEKRITHRTFTAASRRGLELNRRRVLPRTEEPSCAEDAVLAQARSYVGDAPLGRVETTLDGELMAHARRVTMSAVQATPQLAGSKPTAAVVVVEPQNDKIIALDCGPGYQPRGFNPVFSARRPAVSLLKIAIVGAALEEGLSANAIVSDNPIALRLSNGEVWRPRNFDGMFSGEITLRDAVGGSRNIPFIEMFRDLGPEAVSGFSRRIGLNAEVPATLAGALGVGLVRPVDVAAGMATIVSDGYITRPYLVERVFDRDGKVIYQRASVKRTRGIDSTVASDLRWLLRATVVDGTASGMASFGSPSLFAKTGTSGQSQDAWFAWGDRHAAGVLWVGHLKPRAMRGVSGGIIARHTTPLLDAMQFPLSVTSLGASGVVKNNSLSGWNRASARTPVDTRSLATNE